MNTDNMAITAETIDYGPCAFMDDFHPDRVYSSIDRGGRYAYGNQPRIAHWNLARLAQSLLPILADDETEAREAAQDTVDGFPKRFEEAFLACFRAKLGLAQTQAGDAELIEEFLQALAETGADFTNSFRALCDATAGADDALLGQIGGTPRVRDWLPRWRTRLASEGGSPEARARAMRQANPAVIPRNHRVEATLQAALAGDLGPLDALLEALADPWSDNPAAEAYRQPPAPHEVVQRTFCGT
jgi:uncharacterized protein YdiU (UPF0061 family)